MSEVYIMGVGMTRFGKHVDRTLKSLAAEAFTNALKDSGLNKEDIQAAWFANSAWGYFDNQHMIRGQVALSSCGLRGLPVVNVENACGGGATALHSAWMSVKADIYDCVLALGAEKLYNEDRLKMFSVFSVGVDVENMDEQFKLWRDLKNKFSLGGPEDEEPEAGKSKSAAMDYYAGLCQWHMARYGTSQRQLAIISAKNHAHGLLNPYAQYRKKMTVEEVLADKVISWPLTRSMCAPIGDGSAAVILCSEKFLRRLTGAKPVKIRASVVVSGTDREIDEEDVGYRAAQRAYAMAAVGPQDIDVAEVHDASAFGELYEVEHLGFCPPGEGGPFAESGATTLGGKIPVNTSGGLECRGHPLGASGLAQVYELVVQLRGEAGARQVENARLALAMNGGGILKYEPAALCVHILERS